MDYQFIEDEISFIDDNYFEIETITMQDLEAIDNNYLLSNF